MRILVSLVVAGLLLFAYSLGPAEVVTEPPTAESVSVPELEPLATPVPESRMSLGDEPEVVEAIPPLTVPFGRDRGWNVWEDAIKCGEYRDVLPNEDTVKAVMDHWFVDRATAERVIEFQAVCVFVLSYKEVSSTPSPVDVGGVEESPKMHDGKKTYRVHKGKLQQLDEKGKWKTLKKKPSKSDPDKESAGTLP